MKNYWVRFGCFLTGYNYFLVKNSSEATVKAVKKYLSAILIISLIWAFIGFTFTERYLKGNQIQSILGAFILVFVVIQIERQIILSVGRNWLAFSFRALIGLVMAIIGSLILDQVMFKDDIEKNKIKNVQEEVTQVLPIKTAELTQQIANLEQSIAIKEIERKSTIDEVTKNPMINAPASKGIYERDSTGKMVLVGTEYKNESIPNPKAELIPQIDGQLKNLIELKTVKENDKLNVQADLEKDISSKVGFLDELQILIDVLLSSAVALGVWLAIFLFFFMIELFVLVNKFFDKKNDYDKIVIHQMDVRIKMIEQLSIQQ